MVQLSYFPFLFRYVPVINVIYGIGRMIRYIILSLKSDDADMSGTIINSHSIFPFLMKLWSLFSDDYHKEIIRSFWTVIGGILALLLAGPISGLAAMVPGFILSAAMKFSFEMVAGAFIQNLFILAGELFSTPFEKLKEMDSEEWENFINNEIFLRTPFLGIVYSLIRATVYFLKANPNEGLLSLADCAINTIWSFGMLGVSMFFHPSLSNAPLYNWLNRQLYDDFIRTFSLLGNIITPEVFNNYLLKKCLKFIITLIWISLEYLRDLCYFVTYKYPNYYQIKDFLI